MLIQSAARLVIAVCMLTFVVGEWGHMAAFAQQGLPSGTWPLYRDDALPGLIGASQHFRRPQTLGHFQAVEISGPEGMIVSLALDGVFDDAQPAPRRAAFLVGTPYRIRLGGISFQGGEELFPSVELIDRLYSPPKREHRFPIPIVFDEDDIAAALRGDLVTRVVYLEDAEIADPISHGDGIQRVLDVSGTQDALHFADQLGRPVAIIRLGSRTPNQTANTDYSEFLFGCPHWFPIKDIYRSPAVADMPTSSGDGTLDLTAPTILPVRTGSLQEPRPQASRIPTKIGG